MYQGKEICQGCGKTGKEQWRSSKNELCRSCKNQLEAGKQAIQQAQQISEEYIRFDKIAANARYVDWVYNSGNIREPAYPFGKGFKYLTTGGFGKRLIGNSEDVVNALNKLLYFVHNPRAIVSDNEFIKSDNATGGSYRVPKHYARVIFRILSALSYYSRRLDRESYERGTDLLTGLASGEYSIDQFNAKISNK